MAASLGDLAELRLAAQRLVGPGFATAAEAVEWLGAVQAQDLPGAVGSVALRTAARQRRAVHAALDAGEVVRSWPMRGTLHLVPAVDLGWMLELTRPRMLAGAATRRAQLGIDDAVVGQAREIAVSALSGGNRLSRDALVTLWRDEGLLPVKERAYHLIALLAQTGTLCWGPWEGKAQAVVLLDEWVPRPRRLGREEGLGQWALRYFRSHGPATVRDFAWWTGLPAEAVRTGVAVARPHLIRVVHAGIEYLMDPATPARLESCRADARGVLLLPGFDEFLLGYRDRGAALPPEFATRVVPGNNGMFKSTVVARGRVVGTWRRAAGGIDATPFTAFPAAVARTLPARYAALP